METSVIKVEEVVAIAATSRLNDGVGGSVRRRKP
jgi:hypothetical protein